ncbi:MAG: hypothetical protein IJT89_06325 [Bacteroidaceae bacterium]|nr:hypothetical protein [Bacteroidaceae bacterium]
MAKVTGIATQMSGRIGQFIYRRTKSGTVVYEAPAKGVAKRTEAQMQMRTQWGNLAGVFRQFNRTLKRGFEGLNGRMSDFNAFLQANIGVVKVYVGKTVLLNGGSVLAPYQITRGSLPSVAMRLGDGNVLVSDILLGGLTITATTTVADFSNALIACNDDYEAGDQLTFFYGRQTTDNVTGVPRAKVSGFKVMLDPQDTMPLWDVVSPLGFSSAEGCLAMNDGISDAAAVWVHSREDGAGGVRVSTQFMYVDSGILDKYQGSEAMKDAADSYGGINNSAVYLNPNSMKQTND